MYRLAGGDILRGTYLHRGSQLRKRPAVPQRPELEAPQLLRSLSKQLVVPVGSESGVAFEVDRERLLHPLFRRIGLLRNRFLANLQAPQPDAQLVEIRLPARVSRCSWRGRGGGLHSPIPAGAFGRSQNAERGDAMVRLEMR